MATPDQQRSQPQRKIAPSVLEGEETIYDAAALALKAGLDELCPAEHLVDKCLSRHFFTQKCEKELTNAINVAYNMSYTFQSLAHYFDRDCVALPGLVKFYKTRSLEERADALSLSNYTAKRGGSIELKKIHEPMSEYNHEQKGDALYAMELTLAMEKLQFERYLALTKVAEEAGDDEMALYLSQDFLQPQVRLLKQHGEYVAQLRLVDTGHGVWNWDKELLKVSSAV